MSERAGSDHGLALNVLVIGGALFIGYKVLSGLLDKFKEGTDKVGGAIGTQVAKWLLPAPVGVIGKIVLQHNQQIVDPLQYPIQWITSTRPDAAAYGGQLPVIQYMGVTYVIGQHDLNGNYPAVKL